MDGVEQSEFRPREEVSFPPARPLSEDKVKEAFASMVYKGFVDDPRNTDNAWIETVAMNYHDDTGNILDDIQLNASDDVCGVQWQEVSGQLNLYANHIFLLERVAELHAAYY